MEISKEYQETRGDGIHDVSSQQMNVIKQGGAKYDEREHPLHVNYIE